MQEATLLKALAKALLASLKRDYPSVVDDLRFVLGTDKDGQDALFVTVVLKDKPRGEYGWEDVRPVEEIIRRKVVDSDPFRFPYVGFELKSELAHAEG